MPRRLGLTVCMILLLAAGAVPNAFAKSGGDRVQFGKSIRVDEGEAAGDLVCIGCSIYMQGSCGDVVAIGGSVLIDGEVSGDVVTVGGSAKLTDRAKIAGDVATVGGGLSRDPEAVIGGDVSTQPGGYILPLLIIIPLLPVIAIIALIWWLVTRNNRPAPIQQTYSGR
jgi:hypothetical protein